MINVFKSIKCKLVFFSLCISLIPIAVITTTYYFNARRILTRHELDEMASIVESKKRHVLCFLEARKGRVVDFSSDGFIKDSLETITHGGIRNDEAIIALSRHLSTNKMPLDHYIMAIAIVGKDGKVIASTKETIIGVDVSGREPFLEATKKSPNQAYISQPCYDPYLDANCMFIATPIISRNSNEPIGVIINAYNPAILNEITIDCTGRCETLEVYLVNRDKIMLTKSRFIDGAPFKQVVDTDPVRKIAEEGKEMAGMYCDYRGVSVVGASAYLPEYGWTLLAEMDEAEAFARLKMLGGVALITGLISMGAAAGAGITFATSASRPIRKLTDATKRLADGDLSYRVEIARKDEIGSLASSFDSMADKLSKEIDGHIQAKEKLAERENYLKTIVDSEPDCVKLVAADGAILEMNAAGMAMIEVDSPDQIIGRSVYSIIIPEYHDAYKALTGRVFRGESGMLEFEILGDKGTRRWLETHAVPLRNAKDEIIAELSITRDITKQRQVREALLKSEASLANAQRIVHLGNWEWDVIKNEVYGSAEVYRILGFPQDVAFTYEIFLKSVHPDDREFVDQSVKKALYEKLPYNIKYRYGSERMIHAQGEVLYDATGRAVQMNGTVQDITEQMRLEEEIRILSSAVEQSPSVVIITDTKGNIEYTNPRFTQLTGYALPEVLGKNLRILKSGQTPPAEYKQLWKTIISGGEWRGEFCNKKKNGELYWEAASISPIKNAAGIITHFVAVKEDITERKEMEKELKSAMEERDKKIEELKHLMEFSDLMRDERQEDALIKHMATVLKERFQPDFMTVLMVDKEKNTIVAPVIDPPMSLDKFIRCETVLDPSLCRVMRTGHGVVIKDVTKEPVCECLSYAMDEGGYACLPLFTGGSSVGTVLTIKKEKGYWDNKETGKLLSTYIGLASSALDNVRLISLTKQASITDALTGMYNRRFFAETLEKQMSLAKRHKEPLCLLIADLDHFKNLNDTYGHTAGDRALQKVSAILKDSIRTSDVLCRYGGEEFAIIMPKTGISGALEKAEKIRQYTESAGFDTVAPGKSVGITISIGIASFPENGTEYDVLVDAADGALYKAKRNGRNRVEMA